MKKIAIALVFVLLISGGFYYTQTSRQPDPADEDISINNDSTLIQPDEDETNYQLFLSLLKNTGTTATTDIEYALFEAFNQYDFTTTDTDNILYEALGRRSYPSIETNQTGLSIVDRGGNQIFSVQRFEDPTMAQLEFQYISTQLESLDYKLVGRMTYGDVSLVYKNADLTVYLLLDYDLVATSVEGFPENKDTENYTIIDLGSVNVAEAPINTVITIPNTYTKVESAIYPYGSSNINKYGGWNAYLSVNGTTVWKFDSYDMEKGGIIKDNTITQTPSTPTIYESSGYGEWLDITEFVKPGKNRIIYDHMTSGDGFGVKIRITP